MTISPQCFQCRHLDRAAAASLHIMRCAAFPEEIPGEINNVKAEGAPSIVASEVTEPNQEAGNNSASTTV